MLQILINELIWHIQQDARKLLAVILIIFFAAFTAGFCAGKVVEHSIARDLYGSKNLSCLWRGIYAEIQNF